MVIKPLKKQSPKKADLFNPPTPFTDLIKKEVQSEAQSIAPPETPKQTTPATPEVYRDSKGNLSGITIDGKTYGGLKPREVRQIAEARARKMQDPIGTVPAGTAAAAVKQQQEAQAMQQQVSGVPNLTEADILKAVPQEPGLERLQTGASAIGGAFAGIGAGAALGTAALPGIGTVVGGIAGGLIGAIGGAYTKITIDKRGDVKQAKKVGAIANRNFGQTIDALNAGLISKDEALQRWNNDKISLYAARVNLKRETDKDLNRFLSGGADELAQIEDYVTDLETIYTAEFAVALANPNPANIKYLYQPEVTDETQN